MKPIFTLLLLFSLISANAQDKWPTQAWTKTSPEKLNLNADSLAVLDRDFAAGKYGNVDGMLIIRHGQIAYEASYSHNYAELYKQEAIEKGGLNATDPTGPYNYFSAWWHPFYHGSKLHTLQSVSKTITSMIIGVAVTRKEFPDLDTPVLSFFDTTAVKNIDARKRRMTIRHLLTMTAGFDWHEDLPYADPNNSCSQLEASFDWVKFTIDFPMSDEPGKVFNYNSGATVLLAHIFRVATGRDIEEYAVKHLFEPLGIKNHFWKRTPYGLVDSEGGVYLEKKRRSQIVLLVFEKWEMGRPTNHQHRLGATVGFSLHQIWPQPWLRLQVVAGLLWQQTRRSYLGWKWIRGPVPDHYSGVRYGGGIQCLECSPKY